MSSIAKTTSHIDKAVQLRSKSTEPEIGVIGGGIAGAEAARLLVESGANAVLREARDRLGGRAHTVHHDGILIEKGATFVNPWDDYLLALCRKIGVELIDDAKMRPNPGYGLEIGGKIHGSSELSSETQNLQSILDKDKARIEKEIGRPGRPNAHDRHSDFASRLDKMSAKEYFDSITDLSPKFKAAIELHVAADLGRDLRELSALTFIYYEFDPNQTYFRVKGGTSDLIYKTVQGLDSRIELEKVVEMMRHRPDGRVEIKYAGSSKLETLDAVVIAMPFSTLRDVDLKGLNLDSATLRAIKETNYSKHSKLAVLPIQSSGIRDSGLNLQIASQAANGLIWEDNLNNKKNLGALTLFAGGSGAEQLNALGKDALIERIAAVMRTTGQLVPGIEKLVPCQSILMDWSAERFTKGGYSCDLVGDVTSVRGLVKPGELKAGGSVVLAGEHIGYKGARNHLNAAAGSGGEAAKALLNKHKKEVVGAVD